MSEKKYKCGNCGKICEDSWHSPKDWREHCSVCGPLCGDCTENNWTGPDKCKGCDNETVRQDWRYKEGEPNKVWR